MASRLEGSYGGRIMVAMFSRDEYIEEGKQMLERHAKSGLSASPAGCLSPPSNQNYRAKTRWNITKFVTHIVSPSRDALGCQSEGQELVQAQADNWREGSERGSRRSKLAPCCPVRKNRIPEVHPSHSGSR